VPLRGCGHVPMTDDPAQVADVLLRGSRIEVGMAWQRADADADATAGLALAWCRPYRGLGVGRIGGWASAVSGRWVSAVWRWEGQQGAAVREKAVRSMCR
jgi:hypothetical protein